MSVLCRLVRPLCFALLLVAICAPVSSQEFEFTREEFLDFVAEHVWRRVDEQEALSGVGSIAVAPIVNDTAGDIRAALLRNADASARRVITDLSPQQRAELNKIGWTLDGDDTAPAESIAAVGRVLGADAVLYGRIVHDLDTESLGGRRYVSLVARVKVAVVRTGQQVVIGGRCYFEDPAQVERRKLVDREDWEQMALADAALGVCWDVEAHAAPEGGTVLGVLPLAGEHRGRFVPAFRYSAFGEPFMVTYPLEGSELERVGGAWARPEAVDPAQVTAAAAELDADLLLYGRLDDVYYGYSDRTVNVSLRLWLADGRTGKVIWEARECPGKAAKPLYLALGGWVIGGVAGLLLILVLVGSKLST